MSSRQSLCVVLLLTTVLLQGCMTRQVEQPEDFPHINLDRTVLPSRVTGAIYSPSSELALFEDIKARRVGDILTVVLVEQNSGQKSADTNLNQSTAVSVGAPTYGGSTRPNMAIDLNSGNTFTGESGSSQSNSLSGSIAVTVADVLPGGNLLVQGEKWIQINQGKEFIRLQGIIRPRDVGPNNVIYSTQVADARISYSGTGVTENVNVVGWAARVLFSPLWPF
jgi:flagellar L-ring protein precursor FlgH